jgi:cell division protein FtsW
MKTGQSPDFTLLTTILVLITLGWIISFSASLGKFGSYSFVLKQSLSILIGLVSGLVILNLKTSHLRKISPVLYFLTLILLAAVFLPSPIGVTVNNSTRWINLVVYNFQPSEMMKIVVILFMAGFLVRQEKDLKHPWLVLSKTLLIVGTPAILLMLEIDLGAAIIVTLTALSMLLVAGTYLKQLWYVGFTLFSAAGIYITFFDTVRKERMFEFWQEDLWTNSSARVYQTKQALIGIARGDWTGTGIGAGIQKYSKLPEAHTDMIFSVIGEELGIIGMLSVLFAFAYIIGKGFNIAKHALKNRRKYSSYVAFGICSWFSMQISVNIAMNLGLVPPKGFTLPLISYGGTSMIFSIIALAILLRIDMENRAEYQIQRQYV